MEKILEANLEELQNDEELLNLQKKKSRPSVVIEEFVGGGNEDVSVEGSDDDGDGQIKDKKFGVKVHA